MLDEVDLILLRLAGDRVLLQERLIAAKVDLGLIEKALIVDELPLVLREQDLVRTGIDLRQKVALLDDLALLERDLRELSADLGDDVHGCEGRHRAEAYDEDPYVALADGGDAHRLRRRAAARIFRGRPIPG